MNETIPYLPGLSPVGGKELCARFDGGRLSSDGGVLLFAGIERRLGIAELLASRVTDERDPASTTGSRVTTLPGANSRNGRTCWYSKPDRSLRMPK